MRLSVEKIVEVSRFNLHEGKIDDFIDEQENKTVGDVSLLKPFAHPKGSYNSNERTDKQVI